jgi:hypothetical protein
MMVKTTEVQALIKGVGREPHEQDGRPVFNVVLERLMGERGIDTYDDLYTMFTEAGYELDFETFMDDCHAESDLIRGEFVRGMLDVLNLDWEEKLAFAVAILWGREEEE